MIAVYNTTKIISFQPNSEIECDNFSTSWTQPQNLPVFRVHASSPNERAQSPTSQEMPHTLRRDGSAHPNRSGRLPESAKGTPPPGSLPSRRFSNSVYQGVLPS